MTGELVGQRCVRSYWTMVIMGLVFLAQSLSSSFRVADVAMMTSILQDSPVAVNVRGIVLAQRDITVLVDLRAGWLDWGFSFLEAHQLQLYGRHRYNVEWFHFTDESQKLERMANNSQACIVVSNPKGLEELRQAHAPNCKTWIINDEYCKFHGDIRHYYNDNSVNELFVPLGPRHDFDKAYRERPDKSLVSISERPYRFNAIFSKSTSPSRKILKTMLLENPKYTTLSQHYFIQIPWRWQRKMGSLHVNSTRYVDILGQSQFTLSPTGHNPECFRFWESILMGSIPVLVLDEEYQTHQCPNALYPVWEAILREARVPAEGAQTPFDHLTVLQEHAPFIILQNWTQLEATLERIYQEGTEALNTRQKRLIQWYERFMQERVWKVEDYLFRIP